MRTQDEMRAMIAKASWSLHLMDERKRNELSDTEFAYRTGWLTALQWVDEQPISRDKPPFEETTRFDDD